jgi:hypothetical protein
MANFENENENENEDEGRGIPRTPGKFRGSIRKKTSVVTTEMLLLLGVAMERSRGPNATFWIARGLRMEPGKYLYEN